MLEFRVQCWCGASEPINEYKYERIVADSAKEAAEKPCGEPLRESGQPAHLRAVVKTVSLQPQTWTYYALP